MFRHRSRITIATAALAALITFPSAAQQAAGQTILGFSRTSVPVYRILDNDKLTYLGVQPADRYQVKDLRVLAETADGFYVLELGGNRFAFDPSDLRIDRTVDCAAVTPLAGNAKSHWSQGLGEQCAKK